MDYINNLNKEQKEAVISKAPYLRIIAGAGSGKTRVLTQRIVYLIHERQKSPYEICAITFTNKASLEMKERLNELLGTTSNQIHISTIHALCVQIIRYDYQSFDLPKDFQILDGTDQRSVLNVVYKNLGIAKQDIPFNESINFISSYKTNLIGPKEAYKRALLERDETKALIYRYYQEKLDDLYALDFDDLLVRVYLAFDSNKELRKRWQNRFSVVAVDEFQDIDRIQYGIIKYLVGEDNELFVVGDPDQTIYTWRGANVEFIMNFERDFKGAKTIVLNKNYRSTQNILNHANALIQHNSQREHKDLNAHRKDSFPVIYESLVDVEDEARWITRKVIQLMDDSIDLSEIAILYRSNYLSRSIEKVLANHRIPYIIYGGLRFYDRLEIKDTIAYLKMIVYNDDLSLRRSVASPRQGIGEKTIDYYAMMADDNHKTIYEMMKLEVSVGKANARVTNYVNKIEHLKSVVDTKSLKDLVAYTFEYSGLKKHFEKREELDRLESIKELMSDAASFIFENPEGELQDYLQMISLYTDRDSVEIDKSISLMTVHAAKGLEFDNVFVMGLNDGVFPNQNSIIEGAKGIEEERRLMYVAITRARKRLFLSSNSGYSFVSQMSGRPSRFLKEMKLESEKANVFEKKKNNQAIQRMREQKRKYSPGDQVVHNDFGEGIVIEVDDLWMRVAFNFPHKDKKIALDFAGIKRKET